MSEKLMFSVCEDGEKFHFLRECSSEELAGALYQFSLDDESTFLAVVAAFTMLLARMAADEADDFVDDLLDQADEAREEAEAFAERMKFS